MHRPAIILSVVLSLSAGCGMNPAAPGSSQNPVNVHSCAGGTLSGSMSATIDGTQFVATCLDALTVNLGVVGFGSTNVTANNLSSYIDIAIGVQATGPATVQFGSNTVSNASVSVGGAHFWQTGGTSGGTGTVVITTYTANRLAGTFMFDMVAGPGGTGTKTIRNGVFDLTF